jgi:hypothetical protein
VYGSIRCMYSDEEMKKRQREVYIYKRYTVDGPALSMSLLLPALASGAKAGSVCVYVCR